MGTRLAVMISRLEINGFRNHRSTQMDFERLTVIAGPNGVGKTNALRALKRFSPQPDTSFVPSVKKGRILNCMGVLKGKRGKPRPIRMETGLKSRRREVVDFAKEQPCSQIDF